MLLTAVASLGALAVPQPELPLDFARQMLNAQHNSSGYPFRPHSFSGEWKVVADVPGWLSLSGTVSTYAGGAHQGTVAFLESGSASLTSKQASTQPN